MNTLERLHRERLHHDAQASFRAEQQFSLQVDVPKYLHHEPWIRPALSQLGNLVGKRVLDYGCGHGMSSVVLAQAGGRVHGYDLSDLYIREAEQRAIANEVDCEFVTADAHDLPYDDGQFDAVWGNAILHHLDLDRAAAELRRVLKSDGVAVFCEPWGGNPLIQFGRRFLPYPGKDRTPDERPLEAQDIERLRRYFPHLEVTGYQLFGVLRRLWRRESPTGGLLDRIDQKLLRRYAFMQKWARYVVIVLKT